jgi:hypothetical protein
MTQLTSEQLIFLRHHKISLSDVFDAAGLRTKDYKEAMKLLGMSIAIGVSPCGVRGHTMRTRAGHCVQCNPAAITFLKRYEQTAYVYIAGSEEARFLKIGFSEDPSARVEHLNKLCYAAFDWKPLFYVSCAKAGKVEHEVHRKLEKYAVRNFAYVRGDRDVTCFELFSCGYKTALNSVASILNVEVMRHGWENTNSVARYNFELD